ncbi:protein FAM118A isoform X9 [Homo sapiens]|uniref:protein FAM118A isoform X9 n=1 Tax=Homo sapiens TaxID=9606 RepID=UPI0023DEC4FB|nr:protein FAM118A isoform X9 [Homo sapiens]
MDSVEKTTNRSEQKSRKFLKSLIRKQPQELLLVIGTGVSAAVAPGIPALCSWRSCIEAVIEAAEQLEVLHPGDVAEFRRKVTKDRDLLVVAHDLIRKMSPEVLQNLYRTKSFLFVGCGETLHDQIFQALFLYSVPNKVDLEHYMLVLKENEDHFFKHQADMLLHGIKVVSYGDCFDHFPGYVQDLATQICKQQSPDADRVDSTTLLGNACQDCAKRKLEENGIEVSKKRTQSDTDDAGGS